MKSSLAVSLVLLGALAGCSSGPKRVDTSGKHPSLGKSEKMTAAALEAEVETGRLLVVAPATPGALQSGYTVYDEEGLPVAHETNRAGFREQGPVELKLAPGRYFVRLDEAVPGPRQFWVTVQRLKVTRVDAATATGAAAPPEVR